MTQQSHDRLATIAQNTALGSGFDVAMKDLELRGTGNLLGDEQSGHIEGVGFDLYVRMVSEAVEQYKEPERKESVAVTIDLPIEASIPVDYIDSDKLRLEAYQKLASARTEDDLDELRDELTGKEFFNGQLEYDTEEFYSTLTCTLILRNDPDTGRLASATPGWWEYLLHQRDGEVLSDFSWSELSRFLEA